MSGPHQTYQTFDPAPLLARYRGLTAPRIAELLGVSTNTIHAWRSGRQQLKAAQADRLASAIGLHPSALWGDQWWRLA